MALAGACSDTSAPKNFEADDGAAVDGDDDDDAVGDDDDDDDDDDDATDDGSPFDPEPDPFLDEYAEIQEEAASMDVEDLLARYPSAATIEEIGYDALDAVGLDAIEQVFPLSDDQRDALASNGFVALADAQGETFEHAYHEVYFEDLPVLVTSDSILYAMHRSFDALLTDLEESALIPEVELMLLEVHEGLAADVADDVYPESAQGAIEDLDVYLTVARRLLTGDDTSAVTGDEADLRADDIMAAVAAESVRQLEIFGVVNEDYDYSQMIPRGHYEDTVELQRYFQTMIWLGRTDMPLVYFEQGHPVFNRAGFDASYLLGHLLDDTGARERWQSIDRVLRRMIGDPDSMSPADMPALLEALGASGPNKIFGMEDEVIFEELMEGRYGIQRIMSQIMYTDPTDPPLLLPRVHQTLGQRFTIDSYVFHNVTYDRVQDLRTGIKVTRMLPDELDVQFVLGNNEAAHLLTSQLGQYGYQGILHELRFLVDSHPDEFWDESFYSGWLAGIRALNDPDEIEDYPEPMRTVAWQHKTLHTQAASRAELRHDTLLYAKQSYSGGIGCEYPDGYVEPTVAFYERMGQQGALGLALVDTIEDVGYEVFGAREYFENWIDVMATLQSIARKELDGEELSGEEIAFLGMTIEQEIIGCGEIGWDGWYPSLFYDEDSVAERRPTIADVHTAPTDEVGNPKGWIKHAATGNPSLMVMTVPQCDGSATAYVGPISSYYDVLTEDYERLTDSQWRVRLDDDPPARPGWTADFMR